MKRHVWQSVIYIVTGMVFLTACGSGHRRQTPAEPEQSAFSIQEETVPVYQVCEEILFNSNGSDADENALTEALRFQYEYDAEGNKTRQIWYDSFGNDNIHEYEYVFDTEETRVQETYYSKSGGVKQYVDYRYDVDGEMTERAFYMRNDHMVTRFYDAAAGCSAIEHIPCQLRTELGSQEALRYISYENGNVREFATAQYDENGNRIREVIYFADGSPMYSYEYEYDVTGNMTLETVYDTDGVLLNTGRFAYRYDEHGNVIEQRRYQNGKFTGLTRYKYTQINVPKRSVLN